MTEQDLWERIRALTDWMRDTGCGLSADSIEALMTDERSVEEMVATRKRTGHRIGCTCQICLTNVHPSNSEA